MSGEFDNRIAITELIHRYAYIIRMRQGELCGELFTNTATYELREIDAADLNAQSKRRWLLTGREAIRDYIGRSTQSDIRICPLIYNIMIQISGDTARSNCIMSSRTWPMGHETVGQYDDDYRYDGNIWQFQSRVYTVFASPCVNPQ